MEGTRPDTPAALASASPHRRRWVFIVLAVAAVVVVAGVSVYELTRPTPLTVSDGSATGLIEGDFRDYTDNAAPLVRYFNATTYANQSGGPMSALTLRLHTDTTYNAAQGWVDVYFDIIVQGNFASDLHPSGLTLVCNQTGEWAEGYSESNPTNISYDPAHPQMFEFSSGPATFTPTLVNQTGKGPFYEFVFLAVVHDADPLGYNAFVGFRATVSGPFTPAVNVGILLQIIDVPA